MIVAIGAGIFSWYAVRKNHANHPENGMGGTLGLSIVVALGAMFGKILHETGGIRPNCGTATEILW
ncbi:GntT/GntP/DsdX family permease [Enterobacter hormaechei]